MYSVYTVCTLNLQILVFLQIHTPVQVSDWSFPMDRVFHNAAQDSVYNNCVSQIVDKALDGKLNTFITRQFYLLRYIHNLPFNFGHKHHLTQYLQVFTSSISLHSKFNQYAL